MTLHIKTADKDLAVQALLVLARIANWDRNSQRWFIDKQDLPTGPEHGLPNDLLYFTLEAHREPPPEHVCPST